VAENENSWQRVAIYLLLVFAFSSVFYFLILVEPSSGTKVMRPKHALQGPA
jgi:hypothetical protein